MSAKKLNAKLNAAQQGKEILGSVIYWGLRDCRIERGLLAQLFDTHNLDQKYMPPERAPRAAASSAIKHIFSFAGRDGFLARKITSKGSCTFWGVVRENKDVKDVSLAYQCSIKIKFDHAHHTLEIEGDPDADPQAYAKAIAVLAEYKALLTEYTNLDIQRMIISAVRDLGGVSLRKGGGNYFVAYTYHDVLCAIQNVVESIGSSEVGILNISAGDDQSIRSLKRDTSRSFVTQVQELKQELLAFQNSKKLRKSVVKNRTETLARLKANVDMYSEILSMNVEALQEDYRVCEELLLNLDAISKKPRVRKPKKEVEPEPATEEKKHDPEKQETEESPTLTVQEELPMQLNIGRRRRRR